VYLVGAVTKRSCKC